MELSTMKGSEITASAMSSDTSKHPGMTESLFIANIKARLATCRVDYCSGFPVVISKHLVRENHWFLYSYTPLSHCCAS